MTAYVYRQIALYFIFKDLHKRLDLARLSSRLSITGPKCTLITLWLLKLKFHYVTAEKQVATFLFENTSNHYDMF